MVPGMQVHTVQCSYCAQNSIRMCFHLPVMQWSRNGGGAIFQLVPPPLMLKIAFITVKWIFQSIFQCMFSASN